MAHADDTGGIAGSTWVGTLVIDENERRIGKVVDVLYEDDGSTTPDWAVVRTGPLGGDRFLPLAEAQRRQDERVVVPYDPDTVKTSPKAPREHIFPVGVKQETLAHYGIH